MAIARIAVSHLRLVLLVCESVHAATMEGSEASQQIKNVTPLSSTWHHRLLGALRSTHAVGTNSSPEVSAVNHPAAAHQPPICSNLHILTSGLHAIPSAALTLHPSPAVSAGLKPTPSSSSSRRASGSGSTSPRANAVTHVQPAASGLAGTSSGSLPPQLGEGAGKGMSVWRVWGNNWELSVALVALYSITLAIFPGFLAEDLHVRGSIPPLIIKPCVIKANMD